MVMRWQDRVDLMILDQQYRAQHTEGRAQVNRLGHDGLASEAALQNHLLKCGGGASAYWAMPLLF
jgi:hypothetical protein